MSSDFSYATHTVRNRGYIAAPTQASIRESTLLIAGCGIGSSVAVAATRMGFEKFILADGDVVDAHNLNRQFYSFADVGKPKVKALESAIVAINPAASVTTVQAHLDAQNTRAVVAQSDLIVDTVDFLDLPAILRLHDEARAQHKPIVTALSVGFGALVWYFPSGSKTSLRTMLQADMDPLDGTASYAKVFSKFFGRLSGSMDTEVVDNVSEVIVRMRSGEPCPASQVVVGSFGIAALALSMIRDIYSGTPVPQAPTMVFHSFGTHRTEMIDVAVLSAPASPDLQPR
ncbi:ThiF family adenylyltransferase [Caenimonas sp. SL110]|uniref:HesA/MoeB/ThiF family protein n=1 Tax=Caenimonas sp. SL110 TaxID=1450524 RepID=UPI000652C10C|nr:ThiF family adenylyltransferase [Caenimonas sp. SL110]